MNAPLHRFLVVGLTLFVLAVWQTALHVPESSGEDTITTEKEFREKVVGMKNTSERGYSIIHEDGSITGSFNGRDLTGNWTWEGEYFCRSVKLGDKELPDDCQIVTVSGDKVTFIRNRGEGKRSSSRMEAAEKQITTEKEFRAKVVGKKLITERGNVTIQADGSLTGQLGGKEVSGEWTWDDGYYCRSVAFGNRQLRDDCQMVTIVGKEVTFYRKKGYGDGFVYYLEGSE